MNQPCGCCQGIEIVTPEPEANRPGLSPIAYRAGTHATFLETMLARLTTLGVERSLDEITSWLLSRDDLINPSSLAIKLKTPQEPLSTYLQSRFSAATQQLLGQYDGFHLPSDALQLALMNDLNVLVQGPSLYDPQRFAQVALSSEVWELILLNPQGRDLARLNRLLLEAGYRRELAGSEIIYPLRGLTTRDIGDPSIALLDSWATVADVLTFYQERIANEGYLGTATERRSILELAKLVGYKLRPGVAASVYLAFNVAQGFYGEIPAGTRAQSIPGPGETPQFFETSSKLLARDVWNNLKPRLSRPQVITLKTDPGTDASTRDTLYFKGISTKLKPGDALLIVLGDAFNADPPQQVLRLVQSVDMQTEENRTEVTLHENAPKLTKPSAPDNVKVTLQPFIDDASTIFAGSDLANQASGLLDKLVKSISESDTGQVAAERVRGIIPKVQEMHAVAAKRKFTRLQPWLANLLETLNSLVEQLPNVGTAPASGTLTAAAPSQEALSPSALGSLAGIFDKLVLPPSQQPANSARLARTIAQTFSPQADMAFRVLAKFQPAAGPQVYKALANIALPTSQVQVYAMRVKAGLFPGNYPGAATSHQEQPSGKINITTSFDNPPNLDNAWKSIASGSQPLTTVALDATYDKVQPGSWLMIDRPTFDSQGTMLGRSKSSHKLIGTQTLSMGTQGYMARVTQLTLSPHWLDVLEVNENLASDFVKPEFLRGTTVYAQAELLDLAEEPLDTDVEKDIIDLAEVYDGLESGRWIIVSGERTDIPNVIGVTASELVMVSGVAQGTRDPLCAISQPNLIPFSRVYYVTAPNTFGDQLVVGALAVPLETIQKLPKAEMTNQKYCDQVQLAPGFFANAYVPSAEELKGNFSLFAGLLVDPSTGVRISLPMGPPQADALWAWRISSQPVHTILTLAHKLAYSYDRNNVTIYGNVADATHGQTVGEILGNGDASQALQKFALHHSPLTFVSAPTSAGAATTLVVRVNDVEWHEEGNLAGLGPADRSYITETDDASKTSIIFGNGEHGARLPTGAANIKGVYRYGIGKPGNVKAQQISQLATRPPGVKDVINPLPATGGADRDSRDQARRNAPLAVMALDRLVSVEDYADLARTYAGIGKASAARLSDGRRQVVHVTIAGADDIPIATNSDLYRNLVQALHQFGDPYQAIQVCVRKLKLLVISAGVRVNADYQWESVEPKVRAALLDTFGFDRRELGQSAFLSEAISAVQAVEGVEYVDMTPGSPLPRVFAAVKEDISVDELAGLANTLKLNANVQAELARVNPDPGESVSDPCQRILPAELVMLTPDIKDTLILTEISG